MHVPLHYRKVLRWLLIWNKYCGNILFYWTPICVNFVVRSQSQFIVGMSTNRSLKLLLVCVYHFDIHVSALNIICLKKTLNCFANTYNWFHSMATLVAAQCRTGSYKKNHVFYQNCFKQKLRKTAFNGLIHFFSQ